MALYLSLLPGLYDEKKLSLDTTAEKRDVTEFLEKIRELRPEMVFKTWKDGSIDICAGVVVIGVRAFYLLNKVENL